MRKYVRAHSAILLALGTMLIVAAIEASLVSAPAALPSGGPSTPRQAIPLPGPGEDRDFDTYSDAVDLAVGDRILRLEFSSISMASGHPYLLVGTQDDHGRTGKGAELEWRHIVDVDPLGRKAGSAAWISQSVRTGAWVASQPMEGQDRAIAKSATLNEESDAEGVAWPQELILNVRDDRASVNADIELWNVQSRPFKQVGAWRAVVDLNNGSVHVANQYVALNDPLTLRVGSNEVVVTVKADIELEHAVRLELAQQWAPTLRFDALEAFFPVRGDALERFHGIFRNTPNLQTWDREFTDGRDAYRFLLGDFNGDRRQDHHDAAIVADFLQLSELGAPTVYAHVASTGFGGIVIQYWMIYLYNFVLGEDFRDIAALAHDGDRELVQVEFASLSDARTGMPREISFGRHYDATRISDPEQLVGPDGWSIYIARGSHATYPSPGDDRRLRPALAGFYDTFDGAGITWAPSDYDIDLLGNQRWHAGYLWGPETRYGRDFGISSRPLLQHDFRYPFVNPLFWSSAFNPLTVEEATALFEVTN